MTRRRVSDAVVAAIIVAVATLVGALIPVVMQKSPENMSPIQERIEKSPGSFQAEKDMGKKTEPNMAPTTSLETVHPKVAAIKPTEIEEKEKQKIDKSLSLTQPEQDTPRKVVPNKTIPLSPEVVIIKPTKIDEKEERLNEFKGLIITAVTTHPGKPNVALVIESPRTESGVSPENGLYSLLRTDKANIIINLFKEESFKAKGFFGEIYGGDTELLRRSDALSKIDNLILGKLSYSFQKGVGIDRDLVSCNIRFSYKVINRNCEIIRSDGINVIGPGFSEDSSLERGLEILAEKYSDRILKPPL